eukprot:TRINITY_DN234_c0_g1_i2.p1 TRINITY_DN234_c0_g1~~TRINITY_DN234_c0_g1_i2.p1  ORF type:complete len:684 (-),score=165.86 TRINITY_DN234_c0_g1_i2:104-1981(-)
MAQQNLALRHEIEELRTNASATQQAFQSSIAKIETEISENGNSTLLEIEIEHLEAKVGNLTQALDTANIKIIQLQAETGNLTQRFNSPRPPCVLSCEHGGYPSADCTYCKGCDDGWTGADCTVPASCSSRCSVTPSLCLCQNGGKLDSTTCLCQCLHGWKGGNCQELDASVTPAQRIAVLAGLHASALDQFQSLPDVHTNIGNGIDMTDRIIGLPILSMTYNSNQTARTPDGRVIAIPDGTELANILGGTDWPVRQTSLYENSGEFLFDIFQWNNDDGFLLPLFHGISLDEIVKTYFGNSNFMSITQSYYGSYEISLKTPAENFQLEAHAQQALDYLSGLPYNTENQQVFFYFLQNWGTHVMVEEVQGGFLQFGCVLSNAIWSWDGIPGAINVDSDFLTSEAQAFFEDKISGTSFVSGQFSSNSLCNFYCQGGNPELCPTSSHGADRNWANSISANPSSVKYNVVPITSILKSFPAQIIFQEAVQDYYSVQVEKYMSDVTGCPNCLPRINSMLLAADIPWGTPHTIKAGTCSSAIRVTAYGGCSFLMFLNGQPISGGQNYCGLVQAGLNPAMWGPAGVPNYASPSSEWIITDVSRDNVISNNKCQIDHTKCGDNDWVGYYSLYCV